MADIWDKSKRSKVMSQIKSKDTKPEKILRSALHQVGFRFRLHNKNLPGKPDLTFAKYKTVVFVHGCFWHLHEKCVDGHIPKTNSEYWEKKLLRNVERDKEHVQSLQELGWNVIIVWECEIEKALKKTVTSIIDQLNNISS